MARDAVIISLIARSTASRSAAAATPDSVNQAVVPITQTNTDSPLRKALTTVSPR
jgi:hypothetical protein